MSAEPIVACVTGADGFLGRDLCRRLVADGLGEVRALVRRSEAADGLAALGARPVTGDLREREAVERLLAAGCTVFHLAYDRAGSPEDNLSAAGTLVDCCLRAGVRRLVHCSTAMVVGKTRAVMVTEETPCSPVDRYQRTKLEIERLLVGRATTDLEVVIVRPTAVFGPGGENLLKLAREIAAGEHRRPVGYLRAAFQGRRRMNVIPVGNAVAALAFLGTRAGRHDQRLFILAEDDHPANNYADVAAVLASGLGARPFRLPVVLAPSWALRAALRTLGRAQAEPCRRFDCGRLLRAGFRRPCDFVQELRFFAEWFRAEVGQAPRQGVV